jgi:hypothetical protein
MAIRLNSHGLQSLQNNTESQNMMAYHHIGSPPSATISFAEMMLVLLKNLIVVNFFIVLDCFSRCAEPYFLPSSDLRYG